MLLISQGVKEHSVNIVTVVYWDCICDLRPSGIKYSVATDKEGERERGGGREGVTQTVKRATSGQEVVGSIATPSARSMPVGSVSA